MELKERIVKNTDEYNALYMRYAVELEREHMGEYVAIAPGKEPLFGMDEAELVEQAVKEFGSGNFGFWQIGKVHRWRSATR